MTTALATSTRTRGARSPHAPAANLVVRPEDIVFRDETPGRVALAIRITNRGDAPSEPTTATIEAAPFGAFVPWRPLTTLRVPALAPGATVVLESDAARPAARPLGPPDRVAPRRLLTAFGSEEPSRPAPAAGPQARGIVGASVMLRLLSLIGGRRTTDSLLEEADHARAGLPPDLLDLLGQPNPYWAGNLNVFIGGKAVERHRAEALRIHAGRTNLAFFLVGGNRADSYQFRLTGVESGWDAVLIQPGLDDALALAVRDGREITSGRWVDATSMFTMMLALRPPVGCSAGEVHVNVTRRSNGETAVVEFSLDPRAAGAGCYVVG
jgi:hypothetical protein